MGLPISKSDRWFLRHVEFLSLRTAQDNLWDRPKAFSQPRTWFAFSLENVQTSIRGLRAWYLHRGNVPNILRILSFFIWLENWALHKAAGFHLGFKFFISCCPFILLTFHMWRKLQSRKLPKNDTNEKKVWWWCVESFTLLQHNHFFFTNLYFCMNYHTAL